MEYRRLGRSGLKVSEVSLGSWLTFGDLVDEQITSECVHKAYELGVNFFDTANVYALGAGEVALGKAIRDLPRDTIVVATKCFFNMGKWPNQGGLSRKHIHDQANLSLKRLGLDYIDLYQCHRFDTHTPIDETLRAIDDLVRAGKVLYVGVSEWTASQLIEAGAIAERMNMDGIVSNQPAYNMLHRVIEKEVVPTSERMGIGQVVFSPMAQGVLTGKYAPGHIPADSRGADAKRNVWMGKYLSEDALAKAQKLTAVAKEAGLSMPQLALAWCLRLPNVASVIAGATKVAQVVDNVAASGKKLAPEILAKIEDILA
jgi:aryl-alcohol dehydrogenase-like predicted oxidoreductase